MKELYDKSIDGLRKHLLQVSKRDGYMFIGEKKGNRVVKSMQHLACFTSGMLALGAQHEKDVLRKTRDLETARGLAYDRMIEFISSFTCYKMYMNMPTGLSPEYVTFADDQGMAAGVNGKRYLLRPEAIESFYILYTITKDPIYV